MKNWIYIFLLCPFLGFTQDIQVSQWYNKPLYLNPANAGQFDGDYRITAHQREQWASVSVPFSSTSVAFDMPYKSWGFGAQLLRDQSGSSNLSLTQLSFSIARFVESWGFGLHLGFAQQKIDYSELYFLDTGEQIPSISKGFIDIGFGVNNTLYISDSELSLLIEETKKIALEVNKTDEEILSIIETYSKNSVSFHEFIADINNDFSKEEKLSLISFLWDVAYADSKLDVDEERLIRRIADLIRIKDVEVLKLKDKAKN